jgi:integrase/recombinase XerD
MLTCAIDAYLAVRRAAGFQLHMSEVLLRHFAKFAAAHGDTHVSSARAVTWAGQAPSLHQRCRRLDVVRIFARHTRAEDPRHEIPPGHVFPRHRPPFLPFVFTTDQTRNLLVAASELLPSGSLRPWTYCTLLSLLAVTGVRISEALALRLDDITPDGLVIRETKFRKSRLVPLHSSSDAGLRNYVTHRSTVAGASDHVFVSLRARPLNYQTVNAVFLALVRGLGLHLGPGHRGPRIHDLRHTFAVRALEACPPDRHRVAAHMLALSTYMGHAKLVSTYWYLHATPHLLAEVADACEGFAQGESP